MNYKFLLLKIVKNSLNIDSLLLRGLDYMKIAMLLSESIEEGLLKKSENEIVLTQRGEEYLQAHMAFNIIGKSKFTYKEKKFRVPQLDCDDIYIPLL